MTRITTALAALALSASFAPAFAESGETSPVITYMRTAQAAIAAPATAKKMDHLTAAQMAVLEAAMKEAGITDAQRFIITRNMMEDHR